ncbi:MAG: hypothetical protein IT464_08560 [Planctomycetes bacterium]|nr:hypothetical protein [Planctomycetota bacterium]
MRTLGVMFLLLLMPALAAQATLNIAGTVGDNEEEFIRVGVNFGAGPASVTLSLTIQATGGSSGLDVELIDAEELAANGSATAIAGDSDTGTGMLTINLVTGSYSGIVDFIIGIETDAANGNSPYSGTLSAAALAPGALTNLGIDSVPYSPFPVAEQIFNRGARHAVEHASADSTERNFTLDFGGMGQAVTFWIQGVSFGNATISVYEIDSGGVEQLLVSQVNPGLFGAENNPTTSVRSGSVTLRVRMTSPGAAAVIGYTLVFPSSVTITSASGGDGGGGGGGGGGDDGGCSTDAGSSGLLALLAGLSALAVSLRLRRA